MTRIIIEALRHEDGRAGGDGGVMSNIVDFFVSKLEQPLIERRDLNEAFNRGVAVGRQDLIQRISESDKELTFEELLIMYIDLKAQMDILRTGNKEPAQPSEALVAKGET